MPRFLFYTVRVRCVQSCYRQGSAVSAHESSEFTVRCWRIKCFQSLEIHCRWVATREVDAMNWLTKMSYTTSACIISFARSQTSFTTKFENSTNCFKQINIRQKRSPINRCVLSSCWVSFESVGVRQQIVSAISSLHVVFLPGNRLKVNILNY